MLIFKVRFIRRGGLGKSNLFENENQRANEAFMIVQSQSLL
jgi:hypothetical protein